MLTVGFEGRGRLHECAFSSVRPKCLPRSEKHLILLLATRISACSQWVSWHSGRGRRGAYIRPCHCATWISCKAWKFWGVCILYISHLCNQVDDDQRLFLQTSFCSKSSSNQDYYSWFGKESFSRGAEITGAFDGCSEGADRVGSTSCVRCRKRQGPSFSHLQHLLIWLSAASELEAWCRVLTIPYYSVLHPRWLIKWTSISYRVPDRRVFTSWTSILRCRCKHSVDETVR